MEVRNMPLTTTRSLIGRLDQKRSQPAGAGTVRVAPEGYGHGPQDGADDAAATSRVAGDGRSQDQIDADHAVGQSQALLPHRGHEQIRDPQSQTRDQESPGDEEGGHDEPDHRVAESGQGLVGLQDPGEHGGDDSHHRHGAQGKGLGQDPHDGGQEDGQEAPRLELHLVRRRHEPDQEADKDRGEESQRQTAHCSDDE